jgi:hypothetical protein
VLKLKNRKFKSLKDLFSVVVTRLVALNEDVTRFGATLENKTAYSNIEFLHELAEILRFPPDLFVLRVRETLLDEELAAVRREVRAASRHVSA